MISGVTTRTRRCAPVHHIEGDMQAGGGRAAERHVEGDALRAQRAGSRCRAPDRAAGGARAAQITMSTSAASRPACSSARLADFTPNSAATEQFPRRRAANARRHALGVEDAVECQDMTLLDPRGMNDELGVGFL